MSYRRALVVGINDYPIRLSGAVSDAERMKTKLRQFGFAETDIILLRDSAASAEAILHHAAQHKALPAEADSVFVFFFAGHGVWRTAPDGGRLECILTYRRADDHASERVITRLQLNQLFNNWSANVSVHLIYDCCKSGGLTREEAEVLKADQRTERGDDSMASCEAATAVRGYLSPNVVALLACRYKQKSFEAEPDLRGTVRVGGKFTTALCKELELVLRYDPGCERSSWFNVYNKVLERLKQNGALADQYPQLEGAYNLKVFGSNLIASLQRQIRAWGLDNSTVRIEAGLVGRKSVWRLYEFNAAQTQQLRGEWTPKPNGVKANMTYLERLAGPAGYDEVVQDTVYYAVCVRNNFAANYTVAIKKPHNATRDDIPLLEKLNAAIHDSGFLELSADVLHADCVISLLHTTAVILATNREHRHRLTQPLASDAHLALLKNQLEKIAWKDLVERYVVARELEPSWNDCFAPGGHIQINLFATVCETAKEQNFADLERRRKNVTNTGRLFVRDSPTKVDGTWLMASSSKRTYATLLQLSGNAVVKVRYPPTAGAHHTPEYLHAGAGCFWRSDWSYARNKLGDRETIMRFIFTDKPADFAWLASDEGLQLQRKAWRGDDDIPLAAARALPTDCSVFQTDIVVIAKASCKADVIRAMGIDGRESYLQGSEHFAFEDFDRLRRQLLEEVPEHLWFSPGRFESPMVSPNHESIVSVATTRPGSVKVLLVFVHGLVGGPKTTWPLAGEDQSSAVVWPAALLAENPSLEVNVAVLCVSAKSIDGDHSLEEITQEVADQIEACGFSYNQVSFFASGAGCHVVLSLLAGECARRFAARGVAVIGCFFCSYPKPVDDEASPSRIFTTLCNWNRIQTSSDYANHLSEHKQIIGKLEATFRRSAVPLCMLVHESQAETDGSLSFTRHVICCDCCFRSSTGVHYVHSAEDELILDCLVPLLNQWSTQKKTAIHFPSAVCWAICLSFGVTAMVYFYLANYNSADWLLDAFANIFDA